LTTPDLLGVQKAYATFRARLTAYNKRYKPAHVPELMLNTPFRVGAWCRAMRDLYLQVEHDAQGLSPAPLLEKAYRCADRASALMKKGSVNRSAPPGTIRDAIGELEALVRWCDDLTGAAATE
jgi:hypothetical protein